MHQIPRKGMKYFNTTMEIKKKFYHVFCNCFFDSDIDNFFLFVKI
jgi:hypothetical protein